MGKNWPGFEMTELEKPTIREEIFHWVWRILWHQNQAKRTNQSYKENTRHYQYTFWPENAWFETSWNRQTTATDCHTKRSVFMKTTPQKLSITHSKLFHASLCDLLFGNLRPALSIQKSHKEIDAILFWENKQIQTSKTSLSRHKRLSLPYKP